MIRDWSLHAMQALQPHLNEATFTAYRDLVLNASGHRSLHDTALDISIMLDSLAASERQTIDAALSARFGLSSRFFLDSQMRRVRAIVRRGKVRNDAEYDLVRNATSDRDIHPALADLLNPLLIAYESDAARTKS